MIKDATDVLAAVKNYLDQRNYSYSTPDNLNAIVLGFSGKIYKYDTIFIVGESFITYQVRLPFAIAEDKIDRILRKANEFSIKDPVCAVEVLTNKGPISIKAGTRIGKQPPTPEVIEAMMFSAFRLAEDSVHDFLEIINS